MANTTQPTTPAPAEAAATPADPFDISEADFIAQLPVGGVAVASATPAYVSDWPATEKELIAMGDAEARGETMEQHAANVAQQNLVDNPPARMHEYKISYGPGEIDDPAVLAGDTKVREYLAAGGLPKGAGDAIVSEAQKVSTTWAAMEPPARELWMREQNFKLKSMWGEKYEANITAARDVVTAIEKKSSGLVSMLRNSGAANSAFVIVQLYQHAVRLKAAKGEA